MCGFVHLTDIVRVTICVCDLPNTDRNLETINQISLSEPLIWKYVYPYYTYHSYVVFYVFTIQFSHSPPANTSKVNCWLHTRKEVCCLTPGHMSVWILWWQSSLEGSTMLNDPLTFCPSLHRSVEDAFKLTGGRTQPGLCNYGQTTSCCFGWRNVNGICQRRSFCDIVTAEPCVVCNMLHIVHSNTLKGAILQNVY